MNKATQAITSIGRSFERLVVWALGRQHRCEKCGSWDTDHSYRWIRGWNHLCGQAYGDWGSYCHKCGHVTFDTSLEEHIKTLPSWFTPYNVAVSSGDAVKSVNTEGGRSPSA